MSEDNKLAGMESARRYIGAFLVGGVVAGLPAGLVAAALGPNNGGFVVGAALVAGILGGLTAASIPPIRNWIGRAIDFLRSW